MITVKKQGPYEVFSRGVEEPWSIWRDGRPYRQAWTWEEVEKILRGESAEKPKRAHATKKTSSVEELSSRQRALLRDLRRAKMYRHPLSVEVSKEDVARQLVDLGLLRVEPDDDLGLTWVTVTDLGREVATKGGLWGRK